MSDGEREFEAEEVFVGAQADAMPALATQQQQREENGDVEMADEMGSQTDAGTVPSEEQDLAFGANQNRPPSIGFAELDGGGDEITLEDLQGGAADDDGPGGPGAFDYLAGDALPDVDDPSSDASMIPLELPEGSVPSFDARATMKPTTGGETSLFDLDPESFDDRIDSLQGAALPPGLASPPRSRHGSLPGAAQVFHEDVTENVKDIAPIPTVDTVDPGDEYSYFNESVRTDAPGGRKKYDWTGLSAWNVRAIRKKRDRKREEKRRRLRKKRMDKTIRFDEATLFECQKAFDHPKNADSLIRKRPPTDPLDWLLPEDFRISPHKLLMPSFVKPIRVEDLLSPGRKAAAGIPSDQGDASQETAIPIDLDNEGSFDSFDVGGGDEIRLEDLDDGDEGGMPLPPLPLHDDEPGFEDMLTNEEGEPVRKKRKLIVQLLGGDDEEAIQHKEVQDAIAEIADDVLSGFELLNPSRSVEQRVALKRSIKNRQKVDVTTMKDFLWSRIHDGGVGSFGQLLVDVKTNENTAEATISETFTAMLHLANERTLKLNEEDWSDFGVEIESL